MGPGLIVPRPRPSSACWLTLFVSYLLTVHYGTELFWWARTPPPDWRDWLGYMAWLNLAGLLIYRFIRRLRLWPHLRRRARTVWRLDGQRFWRLWLILVPLLLGCVVFIYMRVGGYAGYVLAREIEEMGEGGTHPLQSYGWMIRGEGAGPVAGADGLSQAAAGRGSPAGLWRRGGCSCCNHRRPRGSRSRRAVRLADGTVLIHFWVRRVPRQLMVVGVVAMMLFVYLYGFYKAVALDALPALWSSQARAALAEETGRSIEKVLLDDTSRAGWQAYLLYRVERPGADYRYALGRSYAAALAYPVPRKLWPDKPLAKQIEAAQALWGAHVSEWGVTSNRVLGLQGEMLLNFGRSSDLIWMSSTVATLCVLGARQAVLSAFLMPAPLRILHGDRPTCQESCVRSYDPSSSCITRFRPEQARTEQPRGLLAQRTVARIKAFAPGPLKRPAVLLRLPALQLSRRCCRLYFGSMRCGPHRLHALRITNVLPACAAGELPRCHYLASAPGPQLISRWREPAGGGGGGRIRGGSRVIFARGPRHCPRPARVR